MFHLLVAILFFVLSPGVLLTLPPGSRGIFASGQTSIAAAAIHALVFMVAVHLLWVYVIHPSEGFADMCSLNELNKKRQHKVGSKKITQVCTKGGSTKTPTYSWI